MLTSSLEAHGLCWRAQRRGLLDISAASELTTDATFRRMDLILSSEEQVQKLYLEDIGWSQVGEAKV